MSRGARNASGLQRPTFQREDCSRAGALVGAEVRERVGRNEPVSPTLTKSRGRRPFFPLLSFPIPFPFQSQTGGKILGGTDLQAPTALATATTQAGLWAPPASWRRVG